MAENVDLFKRFFYHSQSSLLLIIYLKYLLSYLCKSRGKKFLTLSGKETLCRSVGRFCCKKYGVFEETATLLIWVLLELVEKCSISAAVLNQQFQRSWFFLIFTNQVLFKKKDSFEHLSSLKLFESYVFKYWLIKILLNLSFLWSIEWAQKCILFQLKILTLFCRASSNIA